MGMGGWRIIVLVALGFSLGVFFMRVALMPNPAAASAVGDRVTAPTTTGSTPQPQDGSSVVDSVELQGGEPGRQPVPPGSASSLRASSASPTSPSVSDLPTSPSSLGTVRGSLSHVGGGARDDASSGHTQAAAREHSPGAGEAGLPLCTSNTPGGKWDCMQQPNTTWLLPQLSQDCFTNPSPWRPDGCRLNPPAWLASRTEEVCSVLSQFQTVTFVGDSFVRNVYVALLHMANTQPETIRCLDPHANLSLVSSPLVSCARGENRFAGACARPPPVCCVKKEPGVVESGSLDSLRSVFLARKYQHVHTDSLPNFCGGALKSTMVRIYSWTDRRESRAKGFALSHLRKLKKARGQHLLVIGAGIHYMTGERAKGAARKAWPFFRDITNVVKSPPTKQLPGEFTVVMLATHYRKPKVKYEKSQSNARTKDVMDRLISKLKAAMHGCENCAADVIGGSPSSTGLAAPDIALGTSTPIPKTAKKKNRLLVVDTWRVTKALIEGCPRESPAFPPDGSHFRGAGEFVQARLLLNVLIEDHVRRGSAKASTARLRA